MLTAGGYNARRRANLKAASPLQKTAESIANLESLLPASSPSGAPELVFDDPTDLLDDLLGVVGMYSNKFDGTLAAKTNQDCAGVRYPFGRDNTAFLAVCDGHGRFGHIVSDFAYNEIPKRLEQHKNFPHDLEQAFKETILGVDQALYPSHSGTTACGGVLQDDNLTLFNVGDSRAMLCSKSTGGVVTWKPLTIDHMAINDEEEVVRIQGAGGHVNFLKGDVSLKTEAGIKVIATTRSIGDHDFRVAGVIALPDVFSYKISQDDKVLIIATAGIWAALDWKEAVQIVLTHLHQGPAKVARALIEEARKYWVEIHKTSSEDITAIVVDLTKWREQVEEKAAKEKVNTTELTDPAESAVAEKGITSADSSEHTLVEGSKVAEVNIAYSAGQEKSAQALSDNLDRTDRAASELDGDNSFVDGTPPSRVDCVPDSSVQENAAKKAHCGRMARTDQGTDPAKGSEHPLVEQSKPAGPLPAQQADPKYFPRQEETGSAQYDVIDLTDESEAAEAVGLTPERYDNRELRRELEDTRSRVRELEAQVAAFEKQKENRDRCEASNCNTKTSKPRPLRRSERLANNNK